MSPGGQESPSVKGHRSSWRRNGQRQSSDGLVEGWIVKGLVVDERPQDMQELVHEDTQGLHFGEWVIGPPLQMSIELSEVVILLDQAQAGEVEHGAQTGATLMGHGGLTALLLAGSIGGGLDPGQLDPLSSSLVAIGITDFRQKDGCGNRA